jgi:hypothetical protein
VGIGVRVVAVSGNSLMNRPRAPSGESRMEVGLGTMQFRQGTLNFKGGAPSVKLTSAFGA